METNARQNTPTPSFTIALPQFLVHWYGKVPNFAWRAAILVFAFGFGISCGTHVLKETLQWHRNLPLPRPPDRKWSEFNFPKYGLRAQLSTEWDESSHELNYKLALMPSEIANSDDFFNRFAAARPWSSTRVTLNVYDERHFVVQRSDDYLNFFTSIVDPDGKQHRVVYQGKLFLSRDQYASLSAWDLTVSGLAPARTNRL